MKTGTWILIIILLCIISALFGYWSNGSGYVVNQITVDSSKHVSNSYETKNYPKLTSVIHDTTVRELTTVEKDSVIQDYFNSHVYSFTQRDSNIYLNIVDTISENRVTGRSLEYKLLRPVTVLALKQKNKLYLGMYVSNLDGTVAFAPSVSFSHNNLLLTGYYHSNNTFGVGVGYKIHIR